MSLTLLFYIIAAMSSAWAVELSGSDVVTGQPVDTKSGAKGRVVVFLSAKCPCSASHIGELRKMAKEYPQFRFLGVHSNTNEDKELTQNYFRDVSPGFPVIQDNGAKIADEFRALKTPHAFVLSPKGEMLYRGGVTDSRDCQASGRNYLREALDDIRQDVKVRTAEARSLGCAISRGGKNVW